MWSVKTVFYTIYTKSYLYPNPIVEVQGEVWQGDERKETTVRPEGE